MKIYSSSFIPQSYCDAWIFLDTNVFISALNFPEIGVDVFNPLKDSGTTLVTIPSVLFEFTRGSQTLDQYFQREEYIKTVIDATYPIERHVNSISEAMPIFQSACSKASYTDYLLALCLYKFRDSTKAYIMTENYKDFPLSIFDRDEIITVDSGKDIRFQCIVSLNKEKLERHVNSLVSA